MDSLHAIIANGLAERYTYLADGVRELAAPLSEEQFWQKPFPFGNSFGHLVLHLTGNLNYYIGAEIAGTGYVRHRDREFTEPKHLLQPARPDDKLGGLRLRFCNASRRRCCDDDDNC